MNYNTKYRIAAVCFNHSNDKAWSYMQDGEWLPPTHLDFSEEELIDLCLEAIKRLEFVEVVETGKERVQIYHKTVLISDSYHLSYSSRPYHHKILAIEHFCNSYIHVHLNKLK